MNIERHKRVTPLSVTCYKGVSIRARRNTKRVIDLNEKQVIDVRHPHWAHFWDPRGLILTPK